MFVFGNIFIFIIQNIKDHLFIATYLYYDCLTFPFPLHHSTLHPVHRPPYLSFNPFEDHFRISEYLTGFSQDLNVSLLNL